MCFTNPEPEEIKALLQRVKTIAVVGFSPRPGRASHKIARQMQSFGFRVIPVRPGISAGLGERAYPDLAAVPGAIDLANVFRAGKYVPEIVDQCLRLGIRNLWLQEGAEHLASAERARGRDDRGHGPLHHARLRQTVPRVGKCARAGFHPRRRFDGTLGRRGQSAVDDRCCGRRIQGGNRHR